MKLCLQDIQPKTFISLTLFAQKIMKCLYEEQKVENRKEYIRTCNVCTEGKKGTSQCFELLLDRVGYATLPILFSTMKYNFFIRVMIEFNLKSNLIKFLSPKKTSSLHCG